jgi:hypothetical protein
MGVDYDAVCFLGWEVKPPEPDEDAEIDPHGSGSIEGDWIEEQAKKHNVEFGEYGNACYGGEAYYLLGYQLHSQDLAGLKQCIATLETHPLCAKYGPPRVHCGVHMW